MIDATIEQQVYVRDLIAAVDAGLVDASLMSDVMVIDVEQLAALDLPRWRGTRIAAWAEAHGTDYWAARDMIQRGELESVKLGFRNPGRRDDRWLTSRGIEARGRKNPGTGS